MTKVRAAIWGTGRVGAELTKQGLEREWLEFVAAIVTTPPKEGLDLGEITGLGRRIGAVATQDADAVLARPDIGLVFYAGLSNSVEAAAVAKRILRAGKDVVMLSGLVHPRTAIGPAAAQELDDLAKAAGRRVVGTGIVPGFLSDILPVALLSTCAGWRRLTVRIVGNMDAWPPGVLRKYAIGLPPVEVVDPASRISLAESVALVGDAAGLRFDRIAESSEPLISTTHREGSGIVVHPGTVTGFRRRFAGIIDGEERVVAEWAAAFLLDPPADGLTEECSIEIEGGPYEWLKMRLDGGMITDLWPATAARGLAVVPGLLAMAPGLYDGAQVPFSAK